MISTTLAGKLKIRADETRQGIVTKNGEKNALLLSGVLLPLPRGTTLSAGNILNITITSLPMGWSLKLGLPEINSVPLQPGTLAIAQADPVSKPPDSLKTTQGNPAPMPPAFPGAPPYPFESEVFFRNQSGDSDGLPQTRPGSGPPSAQGSIAAQSRPEKYALTTRHSPLGGPVPDRPVPPHFLLADNGIAKTVTRQIKFGQKPFRTTINLRSSSQEELGGHRLRTPGLEVQPDEKPNGEPTLLGIEQSTPPSRINPIVADNNALRMTEPVARDLGLQDGEIVKGIVRQDGDALKLLLNGLPVLLPQGHGFKPGDNPIFRVVQTEAGLLLQPMRKPALATGVVPDPASAVAPKIASGTPNSLLSLLLHPRQLSALTRILSGDLIAKTMSALGAPQMAESFQKAQPAMARLNAAALRKAVVATGLWNEAHVEQGKAFVDSDTKTLLLHLTKVAGDDSGVMETTRRALFDIEAAQLQGVQAQAHNELMLNMVIPFSDANPVRMTFERKAPSSEQPDPPYTVNLHSRNDSLGEVWLKTVITGKHNVDMTMWAPQSSVAAAAGSGAQALAAELLRAGLNLNSFVVYNSARQESATANTAPGTLVNVQA